MSDLDVITSHEACVRSFLSSRAEISNVPIDILHAALGIAGEAGEFVELIKKAIFRDESFNYAAADEELGDLMWYVVLYCIQRKRTLASFLAQNEEKLRVRFGDTWTQAAAQSKNHETEAEIMKSWSDS